MPRFNHFLTKCAFFALAMLGVSQVASGYVYRYGPPESQIGFYLGGQIGYGNLHYQMQDLFPVGTLGTLSNQKDVAGRGFFGLDYNQYFGTEIGFTYFTPLSVTGVAGTTTDLDVKQYAVDFMLKGVFPLEYNLSIYAKGGGAYVWSNRDYSGPAIGVAKPADVRKLVPTGAIGIRYSPFKYVSFDLSWQRFFGNGELENADLYALGITFEWWWKHSTDS